MTPMYWPMYTLCIREMLDVGLGVGGLGALSLPVLALAVTVVAFKYYSSIIG